MQPDEGRRHPGLPGDGLRHDGLYDLLRVGARVVVELREQAAPRVAVDAAGEDDEAGEQDEATTHGSRHGSELTQQLELLAQCYCLLKLTSRDREERAPAFDGKMRWALGAIYSWSLEGGSMCVREGGLGFVRAMLIE